MCLCVCAGVFHRAEFYITLFWYFISFSLRSWTDSVIIWLIWRILGKLINTLLQILKDVYKFLFINLTSNWLYFYYPCDALDQTFTPFFVLCFETFLSLKALKTVRSLLTLVDRCDQAWRTFEHLKPVFFDEGSWSGLSSPFL